MVVKHEADNFKIIVITSPDDIPDEANLIRRLLDAGVFRVHIRKPNSTTAEVRKLIEDIGPKYRSRLQLHGHFELFSEFNLGGAHINSRCPEAPASAASISKSCHSVEELSDGYDYQTLSPIFDSISKPGYSSKFALNEELKSKIAGRNVIALGGITLRHVPLLREYGFAGCALLGEIWQSSPEEFGDKIIKIKEICCSL